jgi:PAS domain S-box-containing protein
LPEKLSATEERLQFLLNLEEALRKADSAKAMTHAAAELLGSHLQVGRAGFGDIIDNGQSVRVERDWAGSLGSLAGEARILDAFGPTIIDYLRRGETLVVNECDQDTRIEARHLATWRSIGTKALIVAPLIKDESLAAIFYVHSASPRTWMAAETALVGDVAARTWSAYGQLRAEEALRRSEAQIRAIFDASLDTILILDAAGTIKEHNPAALTMLGFVGEALLGTKLSERLTQPDQFDALILRGMPAQIRGKRLELEAFRNDGCSFPIELSLSPIQVDGEIRFTAHLRDLSEDRRSEQARRASEERLRDITDALPILISYVDREQRFQFVNKPYEIWFNRPIGQIVGYRLSDIMAPEVYAARRPFVERALAGEQVLYDIDMPRPDGVTNTQIIHVPHKDQDGRILGFYALVQDITARKHNESALVESESRFRQLAELSPAFIWSADISGTVNYISRRWHGFIGIVSDSPSAIDDWTVHPEDRELLRTAWTSSLSSGLPLAVNARFRRYDGAYIWHSVRAEPTRSSSGEVTGWLGAITDIHTSILDAEERQKDHDRLWKISQELMLVRDQAGTILSVNPSAKRLLGWDPEEMVGRSVFDFMHPDDRDRTASYVTRQAASSEVIAIQNRYRTADGSYRLFDWRGVTDSGLVHAVGRDITAEHAAEQELRKTEEALRQAQKMDAIGQLTGGIAHDFNNMLAGIIGSLDVIQRRIAAGRFDDITRFIEGAVTSSRRAASLTQRLLAFGRRQALDIRPVEVGKLVWSLHDLLGRTIGEAIDIRVTVDPDVSWVKADAAQLESAILNLAINARDAMPQGGSLEIVVRNQSFSSGTSRLKPGDYVVVSVADTGTGMSADVITKAFEPFFTTKPLGQGTGLGLSMIHGFMGQIGGDVQIQSTQGRGTIVSMFLPQAQNGQPEQPPAATLPPVFSVQSKTVLVVEDDPAVRMLVVSVLDDLGLKSVVAADGTAGLAILASEVRIDLLMTDVGLPGMSGRQLAEHAIQCRPGLKILFITGYAEGASIRPADLPSGMRLLNKPFELSLLAEVLQDMLGASQE